MKKLLDKSPTDAYNLEKINTLFALKRRVGFVFFPREERRETVLKAFCKRHSEDHLGACARTHGRHRYQPLEWVLTKEGGTAD